MPPGRGPLTRETAILRRVVKQKYRFLLGRHGPEEMAKDAILEPDARRVLRMGSVTWTETKKDEIWHVEGKDVDGRNIRLVVVVWEESLTIKLVTAMLI